MKGQEVKELRESLGLNHEQFGKIFGLSISAVYRWEAKGRGKISVDPFAAKLLGIIETQTRKLGKGKFGALLQKAVEHEHDLFALFTVLGAVFQGKKAKPAKVAKVKEPKAAKAPKPAKAKAVASSKGEAKAKTPPLSEGAKANLAAMKAKKASAPTKAKAKAKPAAKGVGAMIVEDVKSGIADLKAHEDAKVAPEEATQYTGEAALPLGG